MALSDLISSVMTGEWRLRRQEIAEQVRFRQLTLGKREMMIKNDIARMKLYAGAEPSPNRPPPNTLSTPEDYKQAFERYVIMRAARELEEDDGFFDGILDDFETYVVGDMLVYMPMTGNRDANKVIREYLEWQFDVCDYSKRLDITKMAQLFVRSMKRDGECGVTPVDVGDEIKVHYYSGDTIGNPLIGAEIGSNNYNGIIADPSTGEPVIYRMYRRLPKLNSYVFDRELNAEEFWHYYDPFRLQQYHGVSAFKNAIRDGFDIDQILEFTKINIKWRASQLPTMHTETGRPRGAGIGFWGYGGAGGPPAPVNSSGVPQPLSVNVGGVTANYMKTDEFVVDYPNDFPNAQLKVSVEEFRRQCCKGAKLPYEFVFRAEAGGVVQRFWADKAMKTFAKDKHWLRRFFLNPLKNRMIEKGIQTGELDLSKFADLDVSTARFSGTWRMGSQISVDYGRETDADLKKMEAGVLSPEQWAADNDADIEKIVEQSADYTKLLFEKAAEIAKDTNQDIAFVLPYLKKIFPNPGAGLSAAGASKEVPTQPAEE